MLQAVYGPEHAAVGSTLNLQARALLAQGEVAAAEPLLVRALAIQTVAAPERDATARATFALLSSTREQLA